MQRNDRIRRVRLRLLGDQENRHVYRRNLPIRGQQSVHLRHLDPPSHRARQYGVHQDGLRPGVLDLRTGGDASRGSPALPWASPPPCKGALVALGGYTGASRTSATGRPVGPTWKQAEPACFAAEGKGVENRGKGGGVCGMGGQGRNSAECRPYDSSCAFGCNRRLDLSRSSHRASGGDAISRCFFFVWPLAFRMAATLRWWWCTPTNSHPPAQCVLAHHAIDSTPPHVLSPLSRTRRLPPLSLHLSQSSRCALIHSNRLREARLTSPPPSLRSSMPWHSTRPTSWPSAARRDG